MRGGRHVAAWAAVRCVPCCVFKGIGTHLHMLSHWLRNCARPYRCRIGELLAQRAQQVGLSGVHWRRRHGEQFHGKRKALINSMRDAGLPLI